MFDSNTKYLGYKILNLLFDLVLYKKKFGQRIFLEFKVAYAVAYQAIYYMK